MRLFEEENRKRVVSLHQFRKRGRYIAFSLVGVVASIYTYTLFSVKQEKFLDDFEEPKKIIDPQ